MKSLMLVTGMLALLWPAGALAQDVTEEPAEAAGQTQAAQTLERETFTYSGQGRRDPFRPLEAGSEIGPRFEDLELSGIIYSPDAGSVVVLVDRSTQRRYRVWEGDVVGGAQLLAVTPDQAVFMVTVFGVSRQETLRLKNPDKEQGG